jgi:hypothetical protein
LVGICAAFSEPARGEAVESIRGRGILERGALFLFADVHRCGPEPTLPVAQIFVSVDGGKTWVKRGPGVPGSEFEYVHASSDGVWVAGLHTAEGPGIDPFLMVPSDAASSDWRLRAISEGPVELRGVGRSGAKGFVAWIRPVDLHQGPHPKSEVVLRSDDGGETWKPGAAAKKSSDAVVKRFARVGARSANWRIVDRKDGGFDLQQHGKSGWQIVKAFPWAECDEGKSGFLRAD